MVLGGFVIEQLSEGFFELFEDGSIQKMDPSRLKNPIDDPSLGKYSSALGIDPLLINRNGFNAVIDPGLGWGLDANSEYRDTSNVVTNLDIFGLSREEVNLVILTHLHFDHVAGATYVSDDFKTKATFPNARYLVHREEWEYALSQLDKKRLLSGADYRLDELYKLVAENRLEFVEDDLYSPVEGVALIKTGGHTPGHVAVKIYDENRVAYYTGDLIPTEYHLNQYPKNMPDVDPIQAKKAKTLLLKQAVQENAILFFYHSPYKKSGRLSRDKNRKFVLRDS